MIDSALALELVCSLRAHYYTDPKIFRLDKAWLLAGIRQFAGHGSLVSRPGDLFNFSIAGESVFCLRDREGVLHGFYNVCQHRAHELLGCAGNANAVISLYHA